MKFGIKGLIGNDTEDLGPNFLCYLPSRNSDIFVIDGYLSAAELIVINLSKGTSPSDDVLFYPFLNLLINPIEFSLKLLINFTSDHKKETGGRCNNFSTAAEAQQALRTHDILELTKAVREILIDTDPTHQFQDVEDILSLFDKIYSLGVNSESSRYTRDVAERPHPLYEKSVYVDPSGLLKLVGESCHKIINYVEREQFYLCKVGEYSRRREEELKTCLFHVQKLEHLFHRDAKPKSKPPSKPIFVSAADLLRDVDGMKRAQEISGKLRKALSELDNSVLANLEMGLYFTNSPATVPDLKFFLEQERDEILEGIIRRSHLYPRALERLEKHYKDVHLIRKTKRI